MLSKKQKRCKFLPTIFGHTDAETLATVREAWLSAHNAYEQTTLYRKLFALFAEESQVSQLTRQQYFIDYWPIYAGYIDYLDSYPGSGLVNDMTVALTPELSGTTWIA